MADERNSRLNDPRSNTTHRRIRRCLRYVALPATTPEGGFLENNGKLTCAQRRERKEAPKLKLSPFAFCTNAHSHNFSPPWGVSFRHESTSSRRGPLSDKASRIVSLHATRRAPCNIQICISIWGSLRMNPIFVYTYFFLSFFRRLNEE